MTRRKHQRDSAREASRRSVFQAPGCLLRTLVLLLLILYVTLLAAGRTAGFSALVQRRLAQAYPALVWQVESIRLSPGLRLHLRGLRAAPDEEHAVFNAEEATLAPSLRALRKGRLKPGPLALRGVSLRVTQTDEGWAPEAFSDWARLLIPGGTMVPAPVPAESPGPEIDLSWPDRSLRVEDASIEWRGSQGERIAAIQGLRLHATPLQAPGRVFTHLRMDAVEWFRGPDILVRDLSVEWLAHGRLRWILALSSGTP